MMRRVQRMAYQHGVISLGIQLAIGFVRQLVGRQHSAALELQGLVKVHGLWCGCKCHVGFHLAKTQALGMTCLAEFIKAPASDGKSALFISIAKRRVCLLIAVCIASIPSPVDSFGAFLAWFWCMAFLPP